MFEWYIIFGKKIKFIRFLQFYVLNSYYKGIEMLFYLLFIVWYKKKSSRKESGVKEKERPWTGLEPATFGLRIQHTTSCVTMTYRQWGLNPRPPD